MNLSDIVKLALSCALLAFASTASATTYYVDPVNGDDTRDASVACFESSPWKTITQALSNAAYGDTVQLAAGEYLATAETLPMTLPAGVTLQGRGTDATFFNMLTPTKNILSLVAADGAAVRDICFHDKRGTGATLHVIAISGGGSPLIENVEIVSSVFRMNSYGISVENSTPVIRNCLIAGLSSSSTAVGGVLISYASKNPGGLPSATIENCTFAGNFYAAVRKSNANQFTISVRDCIFWHNAIDTVNVKNTELINCRVGDASLVDSNGCITDDPVFVDGFRLSQIAAGDAVDSPCVDAGSRLVSDTNLGAKTTRCDGIADSAMVDIGYHCPAGSLGTATDIYVANDGDDELGDGSETNKWRTITFAIANAPAHSRIHVAPGVYDNSTGGAEVFPLYPKNGMSILGEDPRTTIIRNVNANVQTSLVRIEFVVNTLVEGVTVEGAVRCNGGISIANSEATVRNCISRNNRGRGSDGGGLAVSASGYVALDNLLVTGNSADGDTGNAAGVNCASSRVFINNCTITANYAAKVVNKNCGAGLFIDTSVDATSEIRDCIVYGNFEKDLFCGVAKVIPQNCIFGDGQYDGTNGCFRLNPSFTHGYYLASGSPAIDAGSFSVTDSDLAEFTTSVDGAFDTGATDLGFHFMSGKAPDYFVDIENGSDDNAGTNSAAPLQHISIALERAGYGSHVSVAPGTYSLSAGEVLPLTDVDAVRLTGSGYTNTIIDATKAKGAFAFMGTGRGIVEGFMLCNTPAGDASSAIALNRSSPVIQNCWICDNASIRHGSGLTVASGSSPLVRNCVFIRNNITDAYTVPTSHGGCVSVESGSPIIENCTFVSNALEVAKCHLNYGLAVRVATTKTVIRNCVFEGNGLADLDGCVVDMISNCYVSDGQFDGVNDCFAERPMFKDLAGGDYRIDRRSPVGLDAGVTQPWMVGAVDLAGEPRVQNKSVDIGAFETFYPARGTMLMVR